MLRERLAKQFRFFSVGLLAFSAINSKAGGEILRWNDRQPVPGMEGVVPSPEVNLGDRQLEFADFGSMNLSSANFRRANLTYADFTLADLTSASFGSSTLARARFAGALVTGAGFHQTTARGFTPQQLYSTASYQQKNLQGIGLSGNNLSGWDFSGANLRNANFNSSTLTNAILTAADLRGAVCPDLTGAIARTNGPVVTNTIHPSGMILGLRLDGSDELIIRDDDGVFNPASTSGPNRRHPIPVTVNDHFSMSDAGVLRLEFESDPWNSLISFENGIPVALGGTLKLQFTDDTNVRTQVGRTLRVFDWAGVSPSGTLRVESPYVWDLSRLYTSGEVTLRSIPEPTTAVLLLLALCSFNRIRRS